MRFTLGATLSATGGELLIGRPEQGFDGVAFDTRTLREGELFCPLRDVRDGHDFIADAVDRGAAGYLTEGPTVGDDAFAVRVDDTAQALDALARAARARVRSVIGITGSTGKTTTKDFLGHILAQRGPVGVAKGSYNNEIGLPLTLVNAPDGAGWVVVELGARRPGDVRRGTALARPQIGVVTNVGMAHVGIFGSEEAISRSKGELVEALPPSGTAVLNADDELVTGMAERTAASVLTFGFAADADVRAVDLAIAPDLSAEFELVAPTGRARARIAEAGSHIVSCALAAAAAAAAAGFDAETVAGALEGAPRSPHRMQVREAEGGWKVVDDAYNANPASTRAALDTVLRLVRSGGRPLALLGTMAELGGYASQAHREIGTQAAGAGYLVVGVGEHGDELSDEVAADASGGAARLRAIAGGFHPGDVILVKASRCVELDRAVPLLLEANVAPGGDR